MVGRIEEILTALDTAEVVQEMDLYQRLILLTHMMDENRSPARRFAKRDAGGIGQAEQRCPVGDFLPPKAGLLWLLDVVAIGSWYWYQVANRA